MRRVLQVRGEQSTMTAKGSKPVAAPQAAWREQRGQSTERGGPQGHATEPGLSSLGQYFPLSSMS